MEPGAGDRDGNGISRVEAEKPDAGLAIGDHVGANVQLGKRGEAGQGWRFSEAYAGHAERDDRDPSLALEGVDFERVGNLRA